MTETIATSGAQPVTTGLYTGVLSADRTRMTITYDGLLAPWSPRRHVTTLQLPAGATPDDLLQHLDTLGWVASRHTGWSPWGDDQWCVYFTAIPGDAEAPHEGPVPVREWPGAAEVIAAARQASDTLPAVVTWADGTTAPNYAPLLRRRGPHVLSGRWLAARKVKTTFTAGPAFW